MQCDIFIFLRKVCSSIINLNVSNLCAREMVLLLSWLPELEISDDTCQISRTTMCVVFSNLPIVLNLTVKIVLYEILIGLETFFLLVIYHLLGFPSPVLSWNKSNCQILLLLCLKKGLTGYFQSEIEMKV